MEQFLTMLVIDYGGMQSDTRLVPVGRLDFVEALTAVIFCEIHLHNQLIIAKRVLQKSQLHVLCRNS